MTPQDRPGALRRGVRVRTPYGLGGVAYVRLDPDSGRPAAYSVVLDHRIRVLGYTGTVVAAEHVTPLSPEEDR